MGKNDFLSPKAIGNRIKVGTLPQCDLQRRCRRRRRAMRREALAPMPGGALARVRRGGIVHA
jgi:hypothetical protein